MWNNKKADIKVHRLPAELIDSDPDTAVGEIMGVIFSLLRAQGV